jgi:hypothetical protein
VKVYLVGTKASQGRFLVPQSFQGILGKLSNIFFKKEKLCTSSD